MQMVLFLCLSALYGNAETAVHLQIQVNAQHQV